MPLPGLESLLYRSLKATYTDIGSYDVEGSEQSVLQDERQTGGRSLWDV
jgi:hypothetical protein